jgi:preprotein translocase subunit SecG
MENLKMGAFEDAKREIGEYEANRAGLAAENERRINEFLAPIQKSLSSELTKLGPQRFDVKWLKSTKLGIYCTDARSAVLLVVDERDPRFDLSECDSVFRYDFEEIVDTAVKKSKEILASKLSGINEDKEKAVSLRVMVILQQIKGPALLALTNKHQKYLSDKVTKEESMQRFEFIARSIIVVAVVLLILFIKWLDERVH